MYKAVVQSVLLYIIESWVVTGEMLKVLEEFYHRVAQCITRMTAKCGIGREREYPSLVDSMETAGLHPIMVYIRRL